VYRGNGQATIGAQMYQAIGAVIPTYYCPTRRAPQAKSQNGPWYIPLNPTNTVHGQTDYAGCIANGSSDNGSLVQTFNHDKGDSVPGTKRRDPIRLADMLDGTSQVLMIGEKRLRADNVAASFQGDDNEGYSSGWDHDIFRRTDLAPLPDPLGTGDGEQRFGSSHSGGFNAALGDGSVRFIKFTIDCINPSVSTTNCANTSTFWRLGHRADGGVLNDY